MRSLLFVPGDAERKLAKALTAGADMLLIDLEDAIAPDGKALARDRTVEFLAGLDGLDRPPIYVRINDLESGLAEADLAAVVPAAPEGIMLPKAQSGDDVRRLAGMLDTLESDAGLDAGGLGILVLAAETPSAVLKMHTFEGCGPRLKGLTWGTEDLATAIGAATNREGDGRYTGPLRLARDLCLYAAAAAGAQAIDTVYADYRDLEGLERECREAARDGFTGKMAIHPAQVPVINDVFTPDREEIETAAKIIAAFEATPGAGVVGFEGRMLDRPHLVKARRTLERARLAGLT
jgi:citrate lyase subunit beta/citryl-CoA lyase